MSLDKTQVAYHEAGHATMARLLDIDIVSVTIVRHGSSLGHVKHSELAEISVERRVMYYLAGYVALRLYVGADDLEVGQGSLEDIASASSLVESITEGEPDIDARIEALDGEAERRLRSSWNAVERVAVKLLERETLTCAEVDECIDSNNLDVVFAQKT